MKTKVNVMKKVLGFVLTLVIMCSMLPMTSNAAEGTTVYFKPNSNWVSYEAWVSAYCFTDGGGNEWIDLTDTDGDGYYVGTVPGGYEKIIFTRMNPDYNTKEWDKWENDVRVEQHVWTQTANLDVPTAGAPCCFVIVDGGWEEGAWSHAYTDGVCTLCGAYEDGIGAKLAGYSLSVDGKIGVNFYMELDEAVVADETAYMQFTLPDGTTPTVAVDAAKTETIDETTYYIFTCEVAAKEMASDIKAKIVTSTDEGTEYTYTVKEYADELIAKNSSPEEVAFVKAMLNYGAASQTYFGYNASNLANTGVDTAIGSYVANDLVAYTPVITDDSSVLSNVKANLVLESGTKLNVKFTAAADAEITLNDSPVSATGTDYVIAIDDLNATELDKVQTVKVNTATIACSPLSYCYSVLSTSDDANLKQVVCALYDYNKAADAYIVTQ